MRLKVLIFTPILLAALAIGYTAHALYTTIPKPSNTRIPSLGAEVRVDFDSFGVPTIEAQSLLDALRAQGYVIAKERAFQMDLVRRKMEGRLSEVFGPRAIDTDRNARFFNYRKVAEDAYAKMSQENKAILDAYAEGVNAAFQEDSSFERKFLKVPHRDWRPTDSLLVVLSMFQTLEHWSNDREISFNLLKRKFPDSVVWFLEQDFGFFDAVPGVEPLPHPIRPPGPVDFEMKKIPGNSFQHSRLDDSVRYGSNAWAIPSSKTVNKKPILSGDPHLGITLPGIWYRTHLKYPGTELMGVSIPGIPLIVIGTNGKLAWTFTNSDADTVDFVPVKPEESTTRTETIPVRWGRDVQFDIKESKWGPVLEGEKEAFAVQWVVLDSNNLAKLDLVLHLGVSTVPQAIKALERWSGPVQNCFLADDTGNTAWLVVGRIPNRVGFDGRYTVPRDETHYWNGYTETKDLPRIVNKPGVALSSGNQRTSPFGKDLYKVGNSWPSPARAFRIKQALEEPRRWDAQNSASVQLDTLSVAHLWYRDQLLPYLAGESKDPWLHEISKLITPWDGRLSVDSGAYLFVKRFRLEIFNELMTPILKPFAEEEREVLLESFKERDEWRVQLLKHKPMNWLPAPYASYDELMKGTALKVAKELASSPEKLGEIRWGAANLSQYRNPISRLLPPLSFLLDLPQREMNGDTLVPRVEREKDSASMRFTVDLAQPKEALYSQPGGQSGHPLSKNYRDQYDTWYFGRYTKLYPGPTVSTINLFPSELR